jgi:hypothetical protein
MAGANEFIIRRELRSPRAAAIAGFIFSLLMITIMLLSMSMAGVTPEEITGAWLEGWSDTVALILTLTPFAGIAFLWFTGVIRDRLGHNEDRFFATVFLGSSIIFVLLLFTWAAVFGAVINVAAQLDNDLYVFAFALMGQIIGNYALRMAGVYMLAIAGLWHRTQHVPRWLSLITYVLALGFLVTGNRIAEARFIFPAWVLLVSLRILILTYREEREQPGATAPGI